MSHTLVFKVMRIVPMIIDLTICIQLLCIVYKVSSLDEELSQAKQLISQLQAERL